jgi:hypothetical protein
MKFGLSAMADTAGRGIYLGEILKPFGISKSREPLGFAALQKA